MTFEEVNRLLKEYKSNKKLLAAEQFRIQELRDRLTDLRATDFGHDKVCKSRESSTYTEYILDRITCLEDRVGILMQRIFDIEDVIADNMGNLTPLEQAMVIDRYMNGWSWAKISKKYNYADSQPYKIINKAIKKMADNKNFDKS